MMVTVYVSWEGHEILTKELFDEEVEGLVENIKEDEYELDGRILNFLVEKEIDQVDLFHMSEVDKLTLQKEFEKWLRKDAEAQLLDEAFDEIELEL